MGYGHLRAAHALAEKLQQPVVRVDRPPFAAAREVRTWRRFRHAYGLLSRWSQHPLAGPPFRLMLDRLTAVDSSPADGDAAPNLGALLLERQLRRGLGNELARRLESERRPLLTTFYAPALAVDRFANVPVACVVTDTVIHRIWAPVDPSTCRIRYLVPTAATRSRLLDYGIRSEQIQITGFPLPPELEARAREHLTQRLARLAGARDNARGDAGAPRLTMAIGGAGAQAGRARQLLIELAEPLADGRLRLALVAGTHRHLSRRFHRWASASLGSRSDAVEIVDGEGFAAAYRSFNRTLAATDVLWTKPSELVFYAALGLPLVLDDAVGDHERANARWILDAGAGVRRPDPGGFASALSSWLRQGRFAECANSAFERLPRRGADNIAKICFAEI